MVKPLSHIPVIIVHDAIDINDLNNILTLGDYVGETLTLEVVLRCWS